MAPRVRPARLAPAAPSSPKPSSRSPIALLVLSGPNLQLLGTREPETYGRDTLAEIHRRLGDLAGERGARVECRQSNHEGDLLDWLGAAPAAGFRGVLMNPGAYTHTSVALYDAVRAIGLPVIEVHLSNPEAREAFRHRSMVAAACLGKVSGFGANSYLLALRAMLEHLDAER